MAGTQTVWDPLRKKEVALTPEERVRQWFIGVMANSLKVPMHMMMSEASIVYGGKKWRVDILAYDRTGHPLMVVECKRPDVKLDGKVMEQAARYDLVLDVRYLVITNGTQTFAAVRRDGKFQFLESIPTYDEMI